MVTAAVDVAVVVTDAVVVVVDVSNAAPQPTVVWH